MVIKIATRFATRNKMCDFAIINIESQEKKNVAYGKCHLT